MIIKAKEFWICQPSSAAMAAISFGLQVWTSMAGGQLLALAGGDLVTLLLLELSFSVGAWLWSKLVKPSMAKKNEYIFGGMLLWVMA